MDLTDKPVLRCSVKRVAFAKLCLTVVDKKGQRDGVFGKPISAKPRFDIHMRFTHQHQLTMRVVSS